MMRQIDTGNRGQCRRTRSPVVYFPSQVRETRYVGDTVSGAELFVPQVSIAPTRRRRFLWAAWWTAAPIREPFRKPDAYEGGARSREEAKAAAESVAQMTLFEVEPRWARAWGRILIGQAPWKTDLGPTFEHSGRAAEVAPEPNAVRSLWQVLGVVSTATPAEIKQAFRTQVKRVHPDHGGTPAEFMRLQQAYETALRRNSRPLPRRK
jgi:hypothetical protein